MENGPGYNIVRFECLLLWAHQSGPVRGSMKGEGGGGCWVIIVIKRTDTLSRWYLTILLFSELNVATGHLAESIENTGLSVLTGGFCTIVDF